jgi:GNAT superfamily N-acetyltransferase
MDTTTSRALAGFREHALNWGRIEAGASASFDGLIATVTGCPLSLMNRIMVFETLADPEAAFAKTKAFIEERSMPFVVELFVDDTELVRMLDEQGFAAAGGMPFMVHESPATATAPYPEDVTAEIVRAASRLEEWGLTLTRGFGMPEQLAASFAWPEMLEASDWETILAFRDGRAVGTAWACYGNGVTGVFSISSLESERGRGLGAALTVAAMQTGVAAGDELAYLEASAMGLPVYERLGFTTKLQAKLFAPRPADGT